jgi:hypothetical protein
MMKFSLSFLTQKGASAKYSNFLEGIVLKLSHKDKLNISKILS